LARVVEVIREIRDELDVSICHLMTVSLLAMLEARREDSERHRVEFEEVETQAGKQLENFQ
jgi:hypothetical protein